MFLTSYFFIQEQYHVVCFLLIMGIFVVNLIILQVSSQQLAFTNALEYLSNNELQISIPSKYVCSEFKETIKYFVKKLNESRNDIEARKIFNEIIANELPVAILALDLNNNIILSNRELENMLDLTTVGSVSSINDKHPVFCQLLLATPANGKCLIDVDFGTFQVSLSVVKLQSRVVKLYTIESVGNILATKEINSWNKILRVLTHEIMNSITPISSVAQAVKKKVEMLDTSELSEAQRSGFTDISKALNIIGSRCSMLDKFAKSYREHATFLKANLKLIEVSSLFSNIDNLYKFEQETHQFKIEKHCESGLKIWADESLIEQVLINLIKNAIEATEFQHDRLIEMRCEKINHHVIVSVVDNGKGISDGDLENVFVPFFTTKKRGSGIGLSMCRKIMQANNANIFIEKNIPKGTRVNLRF